MTEEEALEVLRQCEVRTGSDGKPGLYMRRFNVRLATFNANTKKLQEAIAALTEKGRT